MQKDVILTPEGLEKLKQEIEYLSTTKRREVAERIKEAREFGDISENSEYDDAKNEQAMLESRIATLEDKLRSASVIDASELSTGRRARRLAGPRQGREGQGAHVHDRRLDRGRSVGQPALQRVAGRQGAARPQEGRRRSRSAARAARARADRSPRSTSRSAAMAGARRLRSSSPPGRRKLEALREAGVDPFPHAYPGVTPIAEPRRRTRTASPARRPRARPRRRPPAPRAAGRARRRSSTSSTAPGGCSCTRAWTCSARSRSTRLSRSTSATCIGVDGTIFTHAPRRAVAQGRRLEAAREVAAPAARQAPGLTDAETRLRHRELDLIANEETREVFITRAKVITAIRRFLDDEGFIEVETPVLQPIYGGALARPFVTHYNALDRDALHADRDRALPQAADRRRPGAGLRDRQGLPQRGPLAQHNPEFTMLEWYEAYAD